MSSEKARALKKRLLTESGIFAAVLAVLGGITFYLTTVAEDAEKTAKTLEAQVNEATTQTNTLRDKFTKVQKNAALYQDLTQKFAGEALTINRRLVRDKFDQFRERYHLEGLKVSMAPVQEMTDAKYRRATTTIAGSEVTVTFDAITDEDVYSLMQAIAGELPGATRIRKFSLTRDHRLTNESVAKISRAGHDALIKGTMNFTWLGFKILEPDITSNVQGKK